jgi:cytochrome P450
MTTSTSDRVHYDNYDPVVVANPHAVMTRLREEAPLYYNPERDFYALSRWEDVEKGLVNRETFISGKGATLDLIRSGHPLPRGSVLFEDPPVHTIHRALVARMFTPKKMNSLEGQVREIVAAILEPKVAEGGFDFAVDLGLNIPMRVIGMLLGIPDDEQTTFRDYFHDVAA